MTTNNLSALTAPVLRDVLDRLHADASPRDLLRCLIAALELRDEAARRESVGRKTCGPEVFDAALKSLASEQLIPAPPADERAELKKRAKDAALATWPGPHETDGIRIKSEKLWLAGYDAARERDGARIAELERERDEMRVLRDKWADASLAANKRAEAAEAREKVFAELLRKVPLPPKAITYDKAWELLDELQRLAEAAALSQKDQPK
jgi:hypothetical protein